MKIAFQLTYTNGDTVTVTARPKQIYLFEQQTGTSVSRLDDMGSMLKLAHIAAQSAGDGRDFDSWLEALDDAEPLVEEEEKTDPLPSPVPSPTG